MLSQQYRQFQQTLLINNPQPLVSYYDYLRNAQPRGDCQYTLYCKSTTYTSLNRDGSICAETRQVELSSENELPAGHHLNRNSIGGSYI